MSGIDGIREIKKLLPDTKIVILSVHEDDENIFRALIAGACGYLTKNTPPVKILESLQEANSGGSPMNAHIASKVLQLLRLSNTVKTDSDTITLSSKEKEILDQLATGSTYAKIASRLNISIHTVRYHIRNIYEKLHAGTQSEAIASAIKKGLI